MTINNYEQFNGGYKLDDKAKDIIVDFHQNHEPPYLISHLARKFPDVEGIYYAEMSVNMSGCIRKNENGKYDIFLRKADSDTRHRFTAAHELAHFLLHRDAIGDGINDDALYRSSLSTSQEVEANKLAADILMPFDKIYALLDSGTRMRDLPGVFNVSVAAMCYRLGVSSLALAVDGE